MKIRKIIAGFSALLCLTAQAQTTLTTWNFDNLATGPSSSPQPSLGLGVAGAVGLGNASNPSIVSLAGSSSGGPNAWRFSATGGGDGWTSSAPIGSQGAQFATSTFGYYQIKVSFDIYATTDAEANLQVEYTTDGHIWNNANITSGGTMGAITSNSITTNSTVIGSYIILTNNGTAGWNNHVTVDLTGISGVDNDPSFAIRIVNASSGTDCVDTTGAPFTSTTASWTFDNVVVQGVSIDTIADWTFESYGTTGFVPNPIPELYYGVTNFATALGFNNNYTYAGSSTPGSTNAPDTLVQAGSSTPNGTICWRVRGAGPNNGWNSAAPIGTQGAEFDVSTVNYSNVVLNFDLYFTTQGEAKMCVLYTTDGWITTNVASTIAYPSNPTFIVTNNPASIDYSASTVSGPYFYQTTGQNFYNNIVVDFTGISGVDNNPDFGVRIVNAATGSDCVAFNGGSYNNSSGNCRFDNVTVGGTFAGSFPPTVNYQPNATVDSPFTNTFTDDPIWRANISSIYVNGSFLTNTAYTFSAGQIVFTPAQSALLQSSGIDYIVINSSNYNSAKITQPLASGVATKLAITTQPAAPSASGGTLTANPVLAITDKYGNGTTNPYASVSITATVSNSVAWTLGGATTQPSVNGIVAFTNMSATVNGSSAVSGAAITFTVSGYPPVTATNSASFTISKPPAFFTRGNLAVLQIDTVANNTTFSVAEVAPSIAGQSAPVNIVPISATGTNALRQSSSGSTGRLSLSDDGTLVCFSAFADGSAATPDETLVLNRASAALNGTNQLVMGLSYTSISLGGSQARAACILDDDYNWIVDDKGGLYQGTTNSESIANPNLNAYNNVVVKTFGGTPYVETQKTANGLVIPVVYALGNDGNGQYSVTIPNNLTTDPVASDFYLVSTNGGTTYDVLYVCDQVSSSVGVLNKFSWVAGADLNNPIGNYGWAANGSFTNSTGVDGLFATTNGSGGVYLFYTTGVGGTAGNSIVRVTDAAGWNHSINITSSNLIYTASKTASLKGLTFVPQTTANLAALIPPPILTAQAFAATNSSFTVTNTPDDPAWRSAITGVTVNGSILDPSAYDTTQPGKIVFNPSQSALLQIPGSKTILISAPAYSLGSVTQIVAGVAAKLTITTQPKAPAADGGALATQPVVVVQDQFGNVVASAASILAVPVQTTWILGGTTTKTASSGTAKFTNLTAFGTNAINGATVTFTSSGLTSVTSSSFNIPAPIKPTLGGVMLTTGGQLAFSFINATGLSFSVLGTNDLTIPVSVWPVVGHPVENPAGSGSYQYTNSATTNAQSFYILRQP